MPKKFEFTRDIQPHLEALFRAAFRLAGNQSDAEELMQETCVRAITHWGDRESDKPLLGWLMRVQYNLYIDRHRQRQRAATTPLDDLDSVVLIASPEAQPEQRVDQQQNLEAVDRAMSRLHPDQRAILVLRVEGYTLAEIQAITGIEIQSLNARLHRARVSLARFLRAEHKTSPSIRRSEGGK